MRVFGASVALSALLFCAAAQDGIYGSVMVGMKNVVNIDQLNDQLAANPNITLEEGDRFKNIGWVFGGEGHLLLVKHLQLGVKALMMIPDENIVADTPAKRRVRLSGGIGLGTIGLNILPVNRFGIHLIPQVGIGASSFIYQDKYQTGEQMFQDIISNPNSDSIATLGKLGLALDAGAAIDWYKPFKSFFTLVPGLDVGPMLHLEVGYTFFPMDLKWRRDIDLGGAEQVEGGPDLKFDGFYVNAGLGLGLSAK